MPASYIANGKTAVLLIHGYAGSPDDFGALPKELREAGFQVRKIVLPGHGGTPQQLAKSSPDDWFQSVREAWRQLRDDGHGTIFAVGHSMGGLLAVQLAVTVPLAGIVTVASPYRLLSDKLPVIIWLNYAAQYALTHGESASAAAVIPELDNSLSSLADLLESVDAVLPQVTCPFLAVQGGQDTVVVPDSADDLTRRSASVFTQVRHYPQGSHSLLVGSDGAAVCIDIRRFLVGCMSGIVSLDVHLL